MQRARRSNTAPLGVVCAALAACAALEALALGGCSAPATPAELVRAEKLERSGDDQGALDAYTLATETCTGIRSKSLRARWCAAALLQRAATLERLGRKDEAATAFEDVADRLDVLPAAAADGLGGAGRIRLGLGQLAAAYDLLWRCLITYPDEAAADEALRLMLRDGRKRDAATLYRGLTEVIVRLPHTEIADNVLAAMADLAEHDLADPAAAIDVYDRLADGYKTSPLRDEALWRGGNLARAGGDPKGALRRWRALLATKEEALFIGSYHSQYLDDAQLEIGRVLRDDLGEPAEALRAFRRVEQDYKKSSVLLDDALYEIAVTYHAMARSAEACQTLLRLSERFPDSKYLIELAPALGRQVQCVGLPTGPGAAGDEQPS